jgi:hypothetical protein
MALRESKRAKGTHGLESAGEGTSQDNERKRANKGDSQTGDSRERDGSGHRTKGCEGGAPTNLGPRIEGQVMTPRESERARCTHGLESADGGTSQENKRHRTSEEYSHTKERAGRDKSGRGGGRGG